MVSDVLAILTPDMLTLIAYLVGAGIVGATIIVLVLFVADVFRLPEL